MPPKTRKTKIKDTNKKESKRKRKPSESEDTEDNEFEVSEEQPHDKNEVTKNECPNGQVEYGKFQKYNKDKAWKLKKIPHYLLPSFNFTNHTDIKDVRQLPLVQLFLPHSVFVNSKFSEDIDFCHRRTIALNSYMTRLKMIKASYLSAKKKNKTVRKNEEKGIYCKPLIGFAERREFNPDKYFVRDYDFYYTGGNLCFNNRSSQIAHVAGPAMNSLVLSVLNIQNNIPKVHKLATLDFKDAPKDECEIFEIQSSLSNDDYLFLRQKHCVSIQAFSNGKISVVQNFKTKDIPFISFTQDTVNTHHLTMSDLVHKIRVCDIEKGVPIQTLKMMPRDEIKPANNWNMIKSIDSYVYIYSACKKVSIIDTRLPEGEWKSNYCGISEENSCYNFCSLARSKFEHLFYVGSNHKAYCVDRRYMGKDIDSKNAVVACWTHQMSTFPLMMATTSLNDSEYIALQSPLSSELRICENIRSLPETESKNTGKKKKARMDLPLEYIYKSPCLPYMPPSIESVFQEARLQGKCMKQGTGMCDRVKACITGLSFTDDWLSPYLLTATSNGDIFARQVHSPDLDVKPDTTTAGQVMCEFEDNIFRTVRKTPLITTDVSNLAGVSKVFRCPKLSNLIKIEDIDYASKRKHMGRWQKSIEYFSKCKDALASDLISIWDFQIDDDKDINITSLNKTEGSNIKVSGWLEHIPEIKGNTILNMTSIPMDVLNASNRNPDNPPIDISSFIEDEPNTNISNIDLDQSAPVKLKTAKKKSKYIKGF